MKKKSLLLLLTIIVFNCYSQSLLTLEEAIKIVMANNYSIIIAKDETQIAKNNVTIGNAGMLPVVDINGTAILANYSTQQRLIDNTTIEAKNVPSSNIISGLNISWTLFDGMKMFATYNKLKESADLSEEQLKSKIETTLSTVLTNYYSLVKQKQLIIGIEKNISIYEERLKIAEIKFNISALSETDYLQAKVDKNVQKALFLKEKNIMNELKISMNTLLSRSAEIDFTVSDTIPITYNPTYDDLKKTVMEQNHSILAEERNIAVNRYALREFYSLRYPKITLLSSYNFSQNKAPGFIQLNQMQGLNSGIMASWTLYSAGNINRQINNAKINLQKSETVLASTKLNVEASLLKAFYAYSASKEMLAIEEENYLVSQKNVNIALERYKLGTISTIELMIIQQSYERSQTDLINARFNAKASEIELMRLNGTLMQ